MTERSPSMGTGGARRGVGTPGVGTPGGVGTVTRLAPPRPGRPRRLGAPPVPREPGRRPAGRAEERAGRAEPPRRMPFFLLLCGLLGGALVCALVISTTLAEGAFEITRLQQANDALARQRQMLQQEVAQARSAQVIEQRALRLGMRPAGELRFLDLKTGAVRTDAGSGAVAAINVPGYTP
ncbi:MAG TPA: hypothetical protein VKV38_00100 [Trebonia sp.]|nr:hypothetical protein [Trebonia sp.]